MDDAIELLEAAIRRATDGPQNGADVRLALGVLKLAGIPHAMCREFWSSAAATSGGPLGRQQSMIAALRGIERFRAGKRPGER